MLTRNNSKLFQVLHLVNADRQKGELNEYLFSNGIHLHSAKRLINHDLDVAGITLEKFPFYIAQYNF